MYPSDVFAATFVMVMVANKHHHGDQCLHISHPLYIASETRKSLVPSIQHGNNKTLRFVVVSDTHDRHRGIGPVPECDVFVHCGDIFMTSRLFSRKISVKKLWRFNKWLETIPAKHKLIIAGNHDVHMQHLGKEKVQSILTNATYLENSPLTIDGLRIWGTPASSGSSPNKAFQSSDFLQRTLAEAPSEVDVLITHGSCPEITDSVRHKVHLFGHNHNSYGIRYPGEYNLSGQARVSALSICAPLMDGSYNLKHLPIVLDVPLDLKDGDVPHSSVVYLQQDEQHDEQQERQKQQQKAILSSQTVLPVSTGDVLGPECSLSEKPRSNSTKERIGGPWPLAWSRLLTLTSRRDQRVQPS